TVPDVKSLLILKAAVDSTNSVLTTWDSSSDPCGGAWLGVSCLRNRVSRVVLEGLGLRGGFPAAIAELTELRVLSLKRNGFSGPVPDLSPLANLKLLYISHNRFSGEFPSSISTMSRLYRLDLSYNSFSGNVPSSINRLTHLLTLRLEGNGFSGSLTGLNFPSLQDFNASSNGLNGEIPGGLSGFPASAFSGNAGLCGKPLNACNRAVSSDPTRIGGGAIATPLPPAAMVASSPTKLPLRSAESHRSKFSSMAIIGIILGDVIVLCLVSLLLYAYFWRNDDAGAEEIPGSKGTASPQQEKMVYYSSPYPNPGNSGYDNAKMVFIDGGRRFELENLLRASAEMLGKGIIGTAYKATLDDGNVVAVKRLKDLTINGKKEFEQQMEVLGRLKHPNLVQLKAYYFARNEKLLVFDYMPNGNLFWLLHGNRGPGRTPLDWATRLRIAAESARGISYIHNSGKSSKLIHGNIKSTNILIDGAGNVRVSDFGLFSLVSPTSIPKSNGYPAPESASDSRKMTQKSDVYSFGVLLLELLTGKCPSVSEDGGGMELPKWVQSVVREEWTAEVFDLELMRYRDIEEEMVGLLQIAMSCTQASPDRRPKMNHVAKMIEELQGMEVSSVQASSGTASDSPAGSEET
ncbi:hypothetical protein M569_15521, partial [Genlisea aurea]